MVIDDADVIRYVSPAAARLLGAVAGPISRAGRGSTWSIPTTDRDCGTSSVRSWPARAGKCRPASAASASAATGGPPTRSRCNRLDDPSVRGVVINYRDVTEQVHGQEELDRQHALLRTLIDSVPDVICFKDRDLRFVGGNPAFERLAGAADGRAGRAGRAATCSADEWADRASGRSRPG